MLSSFKSVDKKKLPKHVAIIMDGNGRWAEEKGKDRLYGHYHGVSSVRTVVEAAVALGLEYLTLYTFSTENWDRPQEEVEGLMSLLVETLKNEVPALHKNNVCIHVIGGMDKLPQKAQEEFIDSFKITTNNTGLHLIIALNYSARWEIVEATKKIVQDVQDGKLSVTDLTTEVYAQYLTTKKIPDPELMIRTGGEFRVSNFLLYQMAYTELYFTTTRWPDFGKEDFAKAIIAYQQRERRFGKTTGQQIR